MAEARPKRSPLVVLLSLRRLWPYFAGYRGALIWGGLSVLATALVSLMGPQVFRAAIDDLHAEVTRGKLLLYAGLIVAVAAIEGLFRFLMRRTLIGISRDIEYDLRNDLFGKLLKLPRIFFDAHPTGDIMNRCSSDVNSVRLVLGPGVMYSINTIATFSLGLVLMLRINVRLTALSLISLPLATVVVFFFARRLHASYLRSQEYFSEVSTYLQETIAGVRLLRAYGCLESRASRFGERMDEYVQINRGMIAAWGIFYPLIGMMGGLGALIVLSYGGWLVIAGHLSIGSFVAFSMYLAMLAWPMMSAGWVLNLFQRGGASLERLHEILDAQELPSDGIEVSQPRQSAPPDIEFRGLTFRYPGSESDALNGLTLRIPGGAVVGIVGRVGCGKSTLASLLTRVYDPPAGTIRVGGRDLTQIPLPELRRLIAIVPQDPFLFSDTIAENLRMGGPEADLERMTSLAGLDHDLQGFPQGLETVIGERGITLSGGQKQRVTIARALARGAPILVFDDSLSSVDVETESQILDGLRAQARSHTLLLISHRVSSIREADLILAMAGGGVVEMGRHDDLISRGGLYASLFRREEIEAELATL